MRGISFVPVSFLLFVRNWTIGNGQFDWTVLQKVSKYGEDLTLLCVVGGCCSKQAGWAKWSPQFSTIFIDVKNLEVSPSFKYDGQVHRDGFTLVIRQFNKTDLDIPYSCSYGYDVSTKKILIKESVFKDKTEEELSARGEGISRATKFFLIIILPTLCGCFVVGIIIMVVVKVYTSNDDKDTKNILKEVQNGEDKINDVCVLKNISEGEVQNGEDKLMLLIHSEEFAVTTCCGRSTKTSIKKYAQRESALLRKND